MSASATRVLLLFAAFVAGLASVFAIVLVVSGRDAPTIPTAASTVGGPFRLTDQNGRTVTDQDLKGHPFLVFFGFVNCPDICPTTLFEVSEVLSKLGPDGAKVKALFISVDPERDTPGKLKDYLASFDPRLVGLTGEPDAIAAVAKAYRAYVKKVPREGGDYTVDHSALVYLMDKDGRFVAPFNLKRPPEAAAADLRRYL